MPLLDLEEAGDVNVDKSSTTDPTLIKAKGKVGKVTVVDSHAGNKKDKFNWLTWLANHSLSIVFGVPASLIAAWLAYKYHWFQ